MAFDLQNIFKFEAFEKYLNENEFDILEVSQTICDSFTISNTSVILYYPEQVHPLMTNIAVNDPFEQLALTFKQEINKKNVAALILNFPMHYIISDCNIFANFDRR